MSAGYPTELEALFGDYPLDQAFDEMRVPGGELRPHYRALAETLARLPPEELQRRKQSADLAFLTQGITFTVYGREEGTERIFPYDLLPRLVTAQEWDRIERGLTQRITALNLFLRDVYSDAKILNDRVIPRELVYSCKHYRRQMRGLQVPRNVYIAALQAGLCAGRVGRNIPDQNAAIFAEAKLLGDVRRNILNVDAQIAAHYFAVGHDLVHHRSRHVDRNRESDALIAAASAVTELPC